MEMTEMDDDVVTRAERSRRYSKKIDSDDSGHSVTSSIQKSLKEPEKRYFEGGGWVERRS